MSYQYGVNTQVSPFSRTGAATTNQSSSTLSRTQQYSQTRARGFGEHPAVLRRRQAEDYRISMDKQVGKEFLVHKKAEWELKTNETIERNNVNRFVRQLKQNDQQKLEERRMKLAQLLQSEDELYRLEISSKLENTKEKAQRQLMEARKFKAQRESNRQKFVAEQYEKQFRENCDDLRTIDSQFFTEYCANEVKEQIQSRQQQRSNMQKEEEEWAKLWEQDRLNKLEKENQLKQQKQQNILENRASLRKQMEELSIAEKIQQAKDKKEKEIFQHILALDAAREKQKQIELIEQKRRVNRENARYNEELEAKRRAEYERQRELDRQELAAKMAEYAEDTKRAENNKARAAADIREFRAYLAARKAEEARMEQEMNRLIQEDLDRANQQRDLQWQREALNREKLMKNVLETRQKQMEEKNLSQQRENQEKLLEKQLAEEERLAALRAEEAEIQAEKDIARRRKIELEQQMKVNRHRTELSKQLQLAEKEAAEEAEREYKARLERFKQSTIDQSKRNYGLQSNNINNRRY